MQLSAFSAEPPGPWDGGDDIVLSITFAHMVSFSAEISIDKLSLTIKIHSMCSPLLALLPTMC
jgi:hypothetical protein